MMSLREPKVSDTPCTICGRMFQSPATLRMHAGSKTCPRWVARKALYARGMSPVRMYRGALELAGVAIEEHTNVAPKMQRWAPEWALLILMATDRGWATSSRTRNRVVDTVCKLRGKPRAQAAVRSVARLAGHKAVARMFKLPSARTDPDPYWWLDQEDYRA